MKTEKEMIWLIKLIKSPHCPSLFKKAVPANTKEIERLLNAPENDKHLRIWMIDLIESNVLTYVGKFYSADGMRKKAKCYTVDYKMALKKLRQNPIYVVTHDFVVNHKTLVLD